MTLKELVERIKNRKDNRELIYLALAVVILLGYLGILLPRLAVLSGLFSESRKLKRELKVVQAELKQIDEYRKKYELVNSRMSEYAKKLPREEEIEELLESLSRLAMAANVRILEIVPIRPPEGGEGKSVSRELPIKIIAKAGYFELLDFIKKLESGMRFIKVADIKIAGDEKEPRRHNIELLITTFVMAGEK